MWLVHPAPMAASTECERQWHDTITTSSTWYIRAFRKWWVAREHLFSTELKQSLYYWSSKIHSHTHIHTCTNTHPRYGSSRFPFDYRRPNCELRQKVSSQGTTLRHCVETQVFLFSNLRGWWVWQRVAGPGLGCRDLGGDKLKLDGEGLSQSGGRREGRQLTRFVQSLDLDCRKFGNWWSSLNSVCLQSRLLLVDSAG